MFEFKGRSKMFSNNKAILALTFKVDKAKRKFVIYYLKLLICFFCNLKVFKSKVFAIKF